MEEVPEQKQIDQLREKGLLGSTLDFSWNGSMHTCCGSPRSYYHRAGCPACGDGIDGKFADDATINGISVPKLRRGAWRKNIEVARVMYTLYVAGPDGQPMSLEAIGKVYGITRQAVYDIFHSRGWELRSKQLKGARVIDGVHYTLDAQGYLRGSKEGKRVYAHKLVWQAAHGPIPEDHVLHFKDSDKQNVSVDNLELVPKSLMYIRFNPERRRNNVRSARTRKLKKGITSLVREECDILD